MAESITRTSARPESIPELLKDVRDQTTLLLRQEVALAKTEVSEKISHLIRDCAYLAAGGVTAFAGALFLLGAITVALRLAFLNAGLGDHSQWLAPLLVGLIVGLIGWRFVKKGISTIKHESLVPEKTLDSLKEDKEWMQSKVS